MYKIVGVKLNFIETKHKTKIEIIRDDISCFKTEDMAEEFIKRYKNSDYTYYEICHVLDL